MTSHVLENYMVAEEKTWTHNGLDQRKLFIRNVCLLTFYYYESDVH